MERVAQISRQRDLYDPFMMEKTGTSSASIGEL